MTDRFKFRVWRPNCILLCTNFGPRMYHFDLLNEALPLSKEDVLMQCTGLKDKNDKLIYEGDIIINIRSPNSLGSEYKWIVEFGEHETSSDYYASRAYGFYAKQIGFDDEASLVQIYDEIEILGNIYQNPELLEVSTKEQK